MPFFAEETLQAVRNLPLYDIVRPHVDLKRSGKNWRGLSPFSHERTPSFFVLTDKNYFKCHSSGLAGDGIKFVQEVERLTFAEAIEALAERFGIPVSYASGAGPDPSLRSQKQALLDIHSYATEYFHHALMADTAAAAQVRDYWTNGRGFSMELAQRFQIGYAPVDGQSLLPWLQKKGFAAEALAVSGLFHAPARASLAHWHPVFRGRLMIPIRDVQGQVVAFTARQLELTPQDHPSWKAKYINSPETPIFKKGAMLFNLNHARDSVRQSGRLILVEGQLDALRCVAVGLDDAIAPQGTSVTEAQIALMKRHTDRLEILMDGDDAGRRSVLRLLPMAFAAQLEVAVYCLPVAQDPDDYLRHAGKDGLATLACVPGIRYAGESLLPPNPTPENRAKVLQELFAILATCPSPVVRDGYFAEVVAVTGVPHSAAREEWLRLQSKLPAAPRIGPLAPKPPRKSEGLLTNAEGDLIWSVLQNLGWAQALAHVIDHQWIRLNTTEGRLLSHILNLALIDPIESIEEIYATLETDDERDCLARYRVEERETNSLSSMVNKATIYLFKQFCRERLNLLNDEIARTSPDAEAKMTRLMTEIRELNRLRFSGPFPHVPEPSID